jgi:outer membrane protein insertion porin family
VILLISLFLSFSTAAEVKLPAVPEAFQKNVMPLAQQIRANPNAYDKIDQLLRTLMNTKAFEFVEAKTDEKGNIEINSRPARKISSIGVKGNTAMGQSEIIKILGLNLNDSFDRKQILEATQKLKNKYTDLGFINTVITVDFKVEPENRIGIELSVTEGPECFIKEFKFDVKNPFLATRLRSIAKKFKGARFSANVLSEFQAKANEEFISDNNRYLNASLSAPQIDFNANYSEVTIAYQITDPYKIEFIFKGNVSDGMDDNALRRAIDPDSLAQLGFNITTEAAARVREYYLNEGYAHVSVNPQVRQIEDPPRREIHFFIEEGPKVKIRKFYIQGQISRPPEYYADFIAEHSSDLIKRSQLYNEKDLDRGYKNLVTELRNQGYFRARIQTVSLLEGPKRQWVDIQMSLYEGPLTHIQHIGFTGNKSFSDGELRNALTVKKDGPLHLNQLEESIELLRQFYLSRGYLEMQILGSADNLVTYNKTSTLATISFNLVEGPKITVNSIIIDGNDQTVNSVILRELKFKLGEPLTPQAIEGSINNLQRLGLFSKIEIETFEKGTSTGPRTVIVRLIEKNPGLFKFGVGLTNENNLNARGYIGVSYRNLFGTARSVSLRLEQNKAIAPLQGKTLEYGADFLNSKITAGYFEPFIQLPFDTVVDGRVNLTRSQQITSYPTTSLPKTDVQESNSVEFLLEKTFIPQIKLTWALYGFSHDSKFFVYERPRSEEDVARIGPSIDFDYRDDIFNPTKGHFIRLNLDYSSPWIGSTKTIEFIRTATTLSHYQPIRKSGWVWANSVRGGYVRNLSTYPYKDPLTNELNAGVPYAQLFSLGTRSTIRGFDPSTELIPRLDDIKANLTTLGVTMPSDFAITDFKLKDETYFYLVKSEFRFPIYGSLGGAIFYDGGAVIIPGFRFEREYRDSAGVGLRFMTPVGPVNFELAYKLNPIEVSSINGAYKESKYQFHFSIGSF